KTAVQSPNESQPPPVSDPCRSARVERLCSSAFQEIPVLAWHHVGRSVSGRFCSLDSARTGPLARRWNGQRFCRSRMGGRRRRKHEASDQEGQDRCVTESGPLGTCRSERPQIAASLLVSVPLRRGRERNWPSHHSAKAGRQYFATAFCVRILPELGKRAV